MTAGDTSRTDGDGLPFLGTVVAAQCHEVVNVLNIVNEVAGLIEDLSGAERDERARVQALAQKIQAQVQRGQGLVRSISRFAHSTDVDHSVVDAVDVLRGALDLLERPVRLVGSTLQAHLPDEAIIVEISPFELIRLLYAAVAVWLGPTPAQVELRVQAARPGLRIEVERDGAAALEPGQVRRLDDLRALIEALGGQLWRSPPDDLGCLVFAIPVGRGAQEDGLRTKDEVDHDG